MPRRSQWVKSVDTLTRCVACTASFDAARRRRAFADLLRRHRRRMKLGAPPASLRPDRRDRHPRDGDGARRARLGSARVDVYAALAARGSLLRGDARAGPPARCTQLLPRWTSRSRARSGRQHRAGGRRARSVGRAARVVERLARRCERYSALCGAARLGTSAAETAAPRVHDPALLSELRAVA